MLQVEFDAGVERAEPERAPQEFQVTDAEISAYMLAGGISPAAHRAAYEALHLSPEIADQDYPALVVFYLDTGEIATVA